MRFGWVAAECNRIPAGALSCLQSGLSGGPCRTGVTLLPQSASKDRSGGPRAALRAGECQEAHAQLDQRRFAAAHYEGLNLMTYCTASAAPRPASRTVAAMAATPAGFARTLAFAACITFTAAMAVESPAFAQQPDAAAPAPKPAKKPKPKPAPEAQQ